MFRSNHLLNLSLSGSAPAETLADELFIHVFPTLLTTSGISSPVFTDVAGGIHKLRPFSSTLAFIQQL